MVPTPDTIMKVRIILSSMTQYSHLRRTGSLTLLELHFLSTFVPPHSLRLNAPSHCNLPILPYFTSVILTHYTSLFSLIISQYFCLIIPNHILLHTSLLVHAPLSHSHGCYSTTSHSHTKKVRLSDLQELDYSNYSLGFVKI